MGAGKGKSKRVQATGDCKATLYRSGTLEKRHDFAPAAELFAAVDAYAPSGRPGRIQALFCSATPEEFMVWHNANKNSGYNSEPRRLFYDGPEPFAYPVGLYNAAAGRYDDWQYAREHYLKDDEREAEAADRFVHAAEAYWRAGTPLSAYLVGERGDVDEYVWERGGSEVLVDPECVRRTQPISRKFMQGLASPGQLY